MPALTILGGGNTAFAVAANLALRGWEITLCELPEFAWTLGPIQASQTIHLDGVAARGAGTLAEITTDFGAALARNSDVLLIVPAYAHRPFAQACAPYLRAGHLVTLTPGTLGALEFAGVLAEHGIDVRTAGITLAETDTAPYVCRKVAPDAAHVWGVVSGLGVGVYPAVRTAETLPRLEAIFTCDGREGTPTAVRAYPHVLACGLSAMNPVVHPAGVLLNAGRVERSRGEFYFYEEGVTPAVCAVIEALDAERRAIGAALGLELTPVAAAFHAAGFGPAGDLWAAINGSRMLTQLRAPGAVRTRWLTEDVPYGIGVWAQLGRQIGIATPVMDALHVLGRTAAAIAPEEGRTLGQLGLAGLTPAEMLGMM